MKITRTTIRKTPGENEWKVLAWVTMTTYEGETYFRRYPEADYFTNEKKDAIETSYIMLGKNRYELEHLPNKE